MINLVFYLIFWISIFQLDNLISKNTLLLDLVISYFLQLLHTIVIL